MKLVELRRLVNMSQTAFAERFGIPVGTLRNWEQEISSPPDYVFQMILASVRREIILNAPTINVKTIKFIELLNEFARRSKNGIEPFENATEDTLDEKIFYYSKPIDRELEGDEYEEYHMVVSESCVCDHPDYYHHDIVSFYEDSDNPEYKIRVLISKNLRAPELIITLFLTGETIAIENGKWYFN